MKKTLKFITAGLLVTAAVCGAASCSGSNEISDSEAESIANDIISDWGLDDESLWGAEETSAPVEVDPKTVDYSSIDITVAWGDSETTSEIASNMWYGSYDGKVVKIEGIAEKLGSWSIMEETGEGSKLGFGFELVDSDEYPVDGARVEMVGVIAPGGSMEGSRVLYVLPENLTVIADAS